MNGEILFATDRADIDEIVRHLRECDERFVPALSTRVDIGTYAAKLFDRAKRFEAWYNGQLIGLIAAYCNNRESGTALITSVSVLAAWAGRGTASRLLQNCIGQARQFGMQRIMLEVSNDNRAAIAFYAKHGFAAESRTESETAGILTMTLTLPNGS